jgi:hypothetical protein
MNENRFLPVVSALSHSLGVSDTAAAGLISQALSSCIAVSGTPTEDWDCIAALLCSLEPRNAEEAMLSVEITAFHYQTVALLSRANKSDHLDLKEQHLKVAMKTSKHYVALVEALKKLRSKCDQSIRVNVHAGAQAVVGHIAAGREV